MPKSNRQKLTQTLINNVRPSDAPTVYWDSEVPGFGLRVMPSGVRSFIFQSRLGPKGRQWKGTIDKADAIKLEAAREIAREWRLDAKTGRDPKAGVKALSEAMTVPELVAEFFETRTTRSKPNEQNLADTYILEEFAKTKAVDLTQQAVAKLHHRIGKTAGAKGVPAPYQANRVLALLSSIYNWARQRPETGVTHNPTDGIKHHEEAGHERYLKPDELERLFDVLSEWPDRAFANIVLLLLLTGARKSEVLHANLDQFVGLDSDGRVFWVKSAHTTKQKKAHRVPLSPEAVSVIRNAAKNASADGRLFPGPTKSGYKTWSHKVWKRLLERADIEGLRLHDLRHTYASLLASSGTELFMIGKLLGHSNASTTQRYAHLTDDAMAEAADNVVRLLPERKSA